MRRILVWLALSLCCASAFASDELFFSEYIEGSSNHKALEIYNPTATPVDLGAGGYRVEMYFNGSSSAGTTVTLAGTVPPRGVFVVAHALAHADILARANQTNSSSWFNGDDAVVLSKGAIILDVIGQIGTDPGSEWGSGLMSTMDNTLQRRFTVEEGDADGTDPFDPADEWDGYAVNTFTGLGCHPGVCPALPPPPPPPPPATGNVVISQLYGGGGNSGATYRNDFIELYNRGTASVDLTGWSVQYASSAGTSWQVTTLSGTIGPGRYYLVQQAAGTGGTTALPAPDASGGISMSATAGKVALVGSTAGLSGSCPTGVVDFVGFGTANCFEGSAAAPAPSNTNAVSRADNGCTDTDQNGADFSAAAPAPRNSSAPPFPCDAPPPPPPPPPTAVLLEIYEIQGSGAASPYAGQFIDTRNNVVTAVGPSGFFIQKPDHRAGGDASTSNGIYVFLGTTPAVQVGDQVDVKGNVVEFFNMTELSGSVSYTVTGTALELPQYVTIASGFSDFEPLEGMLVRLQNGVAAAGTDQFNETKVVATSTRPFRQPGLTGDVRPDIFEVNPIQLGGAPAAIAGGATIHLAEGPLAFSFGDYMIWTTSLEFTNPPLPRPVRARNAGEMTVAAQNVFRFFDDRNDPSIGEPVTDPVVYQQRLARLSVHILENLGAPDVLALSEVENLVTLEDLAHRLNGDASGLSYTAYLEEGHDIGGIDVGFLVRNSVRVLAVEQLGAGEMWTDPSGNTSPLNDRPPLLLRAEYTRNGAAYPIHVVAVHQRSLSGIETVRTQEKRRMQATRLADYVQALQEETPGARIVVTGDFNAFEFDDGYVDVMQIVTSTPVPQFTNQVLGVPANDRYSYVFNGQAQVLDHSLTSTTLSSFVRGLQFARGNADAPVSPSRVSDHDGLVLFLMTDRDADGLPDDEDACPASDTRSTVTLGSCETTAPNVVVTAGCTLADRLAQLRAAARTHGQFVSAASHLLNQLVADGMLTGAEKGAVESCAVRWKP